MYRLGGLVALAVGVFFMVSAYQLSFRLPMQPGPGPGMWPFLMSGVMVASSFVVLFTDRGEDYERFTGRVGIIGLGLVSLAVFIVAFAFLGFIVPGFLTLAFWLRFLGGESWRTTLLLSVLFTAIFYVLFVQLLGVPFPRDVVATLWGGG